MDKGHVSHMILHSKFESSAKNIWCNSSMALLSPKNIMCMTPTQLNCQDVGISCSNHLVTIYIWLEKWDFFFIDVLSASVKYFYVEDELIMAVITMAWYEWAVQTEPDTFPRGPHHPRISGYLKMSYSLLKQPPDIFETSVVWPHITFVESFLSPAAGSCLQGWF